MKPFQSKVFSVVFYDDTDLDTRLFDLILLKSLVAFAYIKHDKDVDENGTLKKCHYHLYLEFDKRVADSFIRSYFNTEIVSKCCNRNYYISYFIHLFDTDKYQYDKSLIKSYNINVDACITNVAITSDNELELLNIIVEYIYSHNSGYYDTFKFCCDQNLFSIYKANYTFIRDIIRYK